MSGLLLNRSIEKTQALTDREAIGRSPKGGASGEKVEVIAPPRMGNDSEGLLLGVSPSAIDRRPAHNLNATTRSSAGSAGRAKRGEDQSAKGEDEAK